MRVGHCVEGEVTGAIDGSQSDSGTDSRVVYIGYAVHGNRGDTPLKGRESS